MFTKPRLSDLFENGDPHLQSGGLDLVELVEVAVDDGVVRQAIRGTRRQHHAARHLLTCRRLVVGLRDKQCQ